MQAHRDDFEQTLKGHRPGRGARLGLLLLALGVLLVSACQGTGGPAVADVEEAATLPPATATPLPPPATATLLPSTPTPIPTPTATLVSGARSAGDPFIPELGNTGYDVLTYTLDLTVDPAAGSVTGLATLDMLGTEADLAEISLDFVGFEISELTVDGVPAGYAREGRKLLVELPQPLPAGGTPFSLAVSYAGQPLQEKSPYIRFADYLGLTFLPNNTFYVFNEPDGARYWFPANDHPTDKAIFHINLTVPSGLAAVSNGQLVDSTLSTMPDGSSAVTFYWQHNYPMAPYLALAAAGHYLRADDVSPGGIPLVYYYFPEFEEEYLDAVDITGEAVDWLSELYGPYPFESYGQATYYAMGVSMENQAMTLLSYQMLNERTVVHELAHTWFGNWVTPSSWADVWRNEGFATYTELLWLDRKDPGALEREMENVLAEVAEKGKDYPLDEAPPERLLAFDAYNRGAVMVHELRQTMGDEAFFGGLRAYFARYGGGTASQAEFQAVMEEAAGFSLAEFFTRWLGPAE